jgi:hypothetical protein
MSYTLLGLVHFVAGLVILVMTPETAAGVVQCAALPVYAGLGWLSHHYG